MSFVVLVAACGSSTGSGSPTTTTTTTTVPTTTTTVPTTPGGLRGVAVQALTCPARAVTAASKPAPIGTPRTFLLCALGMPGQPSKNVTIAAGAPTFAPLVSALSAADAPAPGPGTVCAAYADLPQVVLARTDAGVYQVSIPVDGCGHYLGSALTALQDARAG